MYAQRGWGAGVWGPASAASGTAPGAVVLTSLVASQLNVVSTTQHGKQLLEQGGADINGDIAKLAGQASLVFRGACRR